LLAQFYEQIFPERAPFLKQHWRWLYRVDEKSAVYSPVVAIEAESGRVVGHGGLIYVALQRGSERRDAVWMTDFAILPEHQRGVIGAGLVHTGASLCPLRVAFLNERSWNMVSKLGWQSHFHTTAFQLPLHPEKLPQAQSLKHRWFGLPVVFEMGGAGIRAIERALTITAPHLDALPATEESLEPWAQASRRDWLQAPRSAEFLQWRVLSHPRANQYFVLRSAYGEKGSALARVMHFNGHRRLHLLSLHAASGDSSGLSGLFAAIIRWALSSQIDNIVFVTSDPDVARVAGHWLPIKTKQRFAFHADDEAGRIFLGEADQVWELLDSDFEMMFESEA